MPRGSREQVLFWTGQPRFIPELLELAQPAHCLVAQYTNFLPMGLSQSREARLETFGPRSLPGTHDWKALEGWWLVHPEWANTPNWDIALSCDIGGAPGFILVEAKAHVTELDARGKLLKENPSRKSQANHHQIGRAIQQAQEALARSKCLPGIRITHVERYQFANRVAFAWKLATMGISTVLVYLGFIGDEEIADAYTPFKDDDHWHTAFRKHLQLDGAPEPVTMVCRAEAAPFWLLSRCRGAQVSPEISSTVGRRRSSF